MPLKVIVVGAGLAGLGAAIALNQQGHDVDVFEQSSFLNEVGAAIHIPPNATRVLNEWGVDRNDLQGTFCYHLTVNDAEGNLLMKAADTKKLQATLQMQDDWLLSHRVDLHNALRRRVEKEVNGKKPSIHLASKIRSVLTDRPEQDAEKGTIYLEDGTSFSADLVVGADGMHSRTVEEIAQKPQTKVSTGQNTFRFLVSMEKINANPVTREFFKQHELNGLQCFTSRDRRLVLYPCRQGKLLNVVALHPTSENPTAAESSWLAGGTLDDLVSTYSAFCPALLEMCKMAEDLKLWSLASRTPATKFWRGKLVLVGDAAHPTLPHQGQGGAQSFEDGAALAALLPGDTLKEQIPQRLELYNRARYPRAITVMYMSQVNEERRQEMMEELHQYVPDAEFPKDIFTYCWTSYASRDARKLLQTSLVA
ncbi:hypothetical protein LTR10_022451 [Elasticomyces elasticus]|uniref:FAD-binding domain-containing protein n=1 Tax=Exophiala sideris TaxID=1016849 RepID=A0ABR0J3X9_9EURO|nr:hypothetical protein LTR10_022451 [Elasticomyces elasticus]KAK5024887.1 hypothetical protein LTS07_008265 [Exophiala sideris]KAK5031523.1 hypothetical protein LTR13_007851 [Exophiala sideris]KAK5054926.1 hypothetical protein LTR69_008494 [Exophiala sideris]KAK5179805.1 hypothetical protein LTR44_007621 [Eurotiomycetes sp. CCFEE 6388]